MRASVAIPLMMLCLGASGFTQESSAQEKFAKEKLPTGTLRATYIATNPVQAFVDQKTGEVPTLPAKSQGTSRCQSRSRASPARPG
jgi:hypothetical protein